MAFTDPITVSGSSPEEPLQTLAAGVGLVGSQQLLKPERSF